MNTLPSGWEIKKVSESYRILNNLRKPISEEIRELNKGIYPYYGPTKIQSYINTYEQDGEFVLIGEDGDHFLKHSTHKMTQLISGKCTVNNHAHVIASTDIASIEWFYYYFMHKDITRYLTRQGAGRFKLTKVALEKMPILIPPLSEQTKIADILSTWDKAIQTTEQLLANSQQQKKALMQQLLMGKKRLKGFSGEWKKIKLSDLCSITTGKKDVNEGNPTGLYPFFTCAKECTYSDVYSFDGEALLIAGNGVIGTTHYYFGKFEAYQRTYVLQDFRNIYTHFLHQYILFFLEKDIEREKQHGAMPYIKVGLLNNFIVKVPLWEEQQKIAQILSAQDHEIDTLQQKLACLKQEKKALMQKLLSGKVRV